MTHPTWRVPLLILPALVLAAAAGTACKDKGGTTDDSGLGDGGGTDGGGDGGGDTGTTTCTVAVTATTPTDGTTAWYWRDDLQVTLDGATDDVVFSLTDSGGSLIPTTFSTSEGGLVYTITPVSGMTGMETYTLTTQVCGETSAISFETDEYGTPLAMDATSLVGNTYFFDLPGATFVQPAGVGALLSTFLDVPILVGITAADNTMIDLLGAQATRDSSDAWIQDLAQLTWDFPAASFTDAPYFSATAAEITIGYAYGGDIYDIPVYDFEIRGTLSSDGLKIGGGQALGQGDTRNMGPLLGGAADDPTAVCDLLSGVGLVCEKCPDGVQACLTLEAHFSDAPLLDGVILSPVE